MKILYIDCSMGVSGDMLTAALLSLLNDVDKHIEKMNSFGIPETRVEHSYVKKCGINASKIDVNIAGVTEGDGCKHNSFSQISTSIEELNIPTSVKSDALAIYGMIRDAESKAHNVPVDMVHFHEVGDVDAIADVCNVAYLMNEIAADKVVFSPLNLGSGVVRCAHGTLQVPVPAVVNITHDIPVYQSEIDAELTTPTGAALAKYYADTFSIMPAMNITSCGYGAGNRNFEIANVIRAYLGTYDDESDYVVSLSANIDDQSGEDIGFAMDLLLSNGALDVFCETVYMKKNRPGYMLTVICALCDKAKMIRLLFKHTTTIGIRENSFLRSKMNRNTELINTEFGPVRRKVSVLSDLKKDKLEYDDIAAIALAENESIIHVRSTLDNL